MSAIGGFLKGIVVAAAGAAAYDKAKDFVANLETEGPDREIRRPANLTVAHASTILVASVGRDLWQRYQQRVRALPEPYIYNWSVVAHDSAGQ